MNKDFIVRNIAKQIPEITVENLRALNADVIIWKLLLIN